MKKSVKKYTSLVLCTSLLGVMTTACATDAKLNRIQALREQPAKTLQEVMDDSKQAMNYTSFSQRTALNDYKDAFSSVTPDEEKKCTELLSSVLTEYKNGTLHEVSSDLYEYLKSSVDDLAITGQKVNRIKKFNGYYFVTVDFNTEPNQLGQFNEYSKYVGLDNIMYKVTSADGDITTEIDGTWLSAIKDYLGTKTGQNDTPVQTTAVQETTTAEQGEQGATSEQETTVAQTESSSTAPETTASTTVAVENVTTGDKKEDTTQFTQQLRHLPYDVADYESTLGGSTARMAYFPKLSTVYQPVMDNNKITGNGCYNEGVSGLTVYGFSRDKLHGTLQITFVFEQDELNKDIMKYLFAYTEGYNSGYTDFEEANSTFLNVPDFVSEQIGIKVEELDRLVNDKDIAGLMYKETIEDAGLAFKLAQYGCTTEINNYTTKVLGVVGRIGNSYLVKAERTVAECPKDLGYVSQYKETVYYVIRQKDVNFVINDVYTANKVLTKQPSIYEINSKYRQLVALNLSGDVPEDLQSDITDNVLNKLAEYSTSRITGEVGGDTGMYSVFDGDKTILSAERLEYLNSWLRGILLKKGTPSTMSIKAVQWVNGYTTQVELLTKELVEYTGTDTGTYLENYYVVSNFGGKWVIDDIQNITQKEVSGAELQQLKADFAN